MVEGAAAMPDMSNFGGGFDRGSIPFGDLSRGVTQTQQFPWYKKMDMWLSHPENVQKLSGALTQMARIIDPNSPQVKGNEINQKENNLQLLLNSLMDSGQKTRVKQIDADGVTQEISSERVGEVGGGPITQSETIKKDASSETDGGMAQLISALGNFGNPKA